MCTAERCYTTLVYLKIQCKHLQLEQCRLHFTLPFQISSLNVSYMVFEGKSIPFDVSNFWSVLWRYTWEDTRLVRNVYERYGPTTVPSVRTVHCQLIKWFYITYILRNINSLGSKIGLEKMSTGCSTSVRFITHSYTSVASQNKPGVKAN